MLKEMANLKMLWFLNQANNGLTGYTTGILIVEKARMLIYNNYLIGTLESLCGDADFDGRENIIAN